MTGCKCAVASLPCQLGSCWIFSATARLKSCFVSLAGDAERSQLVAKYFLSRNDEATAQRYSAVLEGCLCSRLVGERVGGREHVKCVLICRFTQAVRGKFPKLALAEWLKKLTKPRKENLVVF